MRLAAAKGRDEVTAMPPTPKAAREGEERRSAPAATASPRGGTPGRGGSLAGSPTCNWTRGDGRNATAMSGVRGP